MSIPSRPASPPRVSCNSFCHRPPYQVSESGLRCLRRIVLCLGWSFALGPAALGTSLPATAEVPKTVSLPQPESLAQIWRDAQQEQQRAERNAAVPRLSLNAPVRLFPPVSHLTATRPFPRTLLDEVGHLLRPVPPTQIVAWRQELTKSHLPTRRAALLHLWLGDQYDGRDELTQDASARNGGYAFACDGDGSPVNYNAACAYDPEARQTGFGGTQTNTYTGTLVCALLRGMGVTSPCASPRPQNAPCRGAARPPSAPLDKPAYFF